MSPFPLQNTLTAYISSAGVEVERFKGCSSISRKGVMFRLILNSLPLGSVGVKFVSGSFLPFSQDRAESVNMTNMKFRYFSRMEACCFVRIQMYCFYVL